MSRVSLALNPDRASVRPRVRSTRAAWAPDPKRVLAIAAAISAHILLFGAMLMPAERHFTPTADVDPDIVFEVPKLPPPPEKPIVAIITPKAPTVPIVRPQPVAPEPKAIDVPVQVASFPVPSNEPEQVPIVDPPSTGGGSVADSVMQVIKAPPPSYPYTFIKQGISGTVEFRVLVNAQGIPEKVELLKSSGNRKLDQLSLSHIKRRWRFRAPEVDGVASAGWGRGKISFKLDQN